MAEYKGLTIRIGGDTSQLNSALKASTKAASVLDARIRQINRAMRFDPGNLANVDTRMRLTTNRAEALYSKITLIKNAYKELGETTVNVGGSATSVKRLAESTENIALAATTAKERYNDMTATLSANYRELEARAKEAGQAMDLNALSRNGTDETFESQMAALKELGVITDEEIQKLREMRAAWNEAFNDSEAYDAAADLEKMSVDMQRLESEARNAAATVRELNTVSRYSADTWQESAARVKSVDAALSECAKQAKAYEAALREDPSNMQAALGRLRALSNEYELAEFKASELNRQVEAYQQHLSKTLAKEKNLPMFIQKTGDEWQQAQNELAEAKGKADALHQSLQRLKDAHAPDEEIRKLEAEVREADAKVRELSVHAAEMDAKFETAKECAELESLQAELAETSAHAKALKERMGLTGLGGKSFLNASTIKSAGMTLYSTLTPAITMLGWRAITAAQDIDSAYRDMRKTVNGTETQFEELRRAAIEFSKTHVTSAEQILQIEAIGGELGIATENLQAFAETVSNLDVATNLDTEQAATTLGKLANITHMGAEEYDNYADALVRLGNNGASTEDQIVDIATRIGSMGTIVGMTVPEILALSSSIASTGMKTEAAGTAISNTFSDIESAVANGGDNLDKFAAVAGTSAEEFARSWETHPIEAFKAFIEGLNRIESDGGSAVSTLEDLKITGERQKQSILGLMQTIGGLNDNLTMSNDAWKGQSDAWGAAGDAAREAEKKAEGFSGQLQILANIGNDAMASLAEGATPIIAVFTDLAKSALDAFDEMDDGSKSAIVALLGVGAAIGPLLTMASTFMTASQNIKTFLTESSAMGRALRIMKSGFADAGAAAGGMQMRLASIKEGAKTLGTSLLKGLAVGAVVAGIALVVAALLDLKKKMDESKTAAKNAGDVIGSSLSNAAKDSERAFGEVASSYDDMVKQFAENNRKIQESADETYGNTANIEHYADALVEALDAYNNGDRSAESMANLKTQLDLYNSAAGESISFTEDATGALELMRDGAILTTEEFNKLTDSILASTKAKFFQESYEAKMADYRTALESIEAAEREVADVEAAIERDMTENAGKNSATLYQSLVAVQQKLDNTRTKMWETTNAMGQYEEGMNLMAEAQLDNARAGVKWVASNDRLQVALWSNGRSVTEFAHYLDELGVSYDDMQAHSGEIEDIARTWDGSVGNMVASLEGLGIEIDEVNAKKLEDKKATAKINQKELKDAQGNVYTWNGTTLLDKNGNAVVNDQSLVDAQGNVYTWNGSSLKQQHASVTVSQGMRTALDFMNRWNNWTPAQKFASVAVSVIGQSLRSATGSVASSPFIPRHAKGYIATGPTLTNNGWVGEAGAEAVLNWGTGGAVVPLTNTRYMKPIADAIASEMGRGDDTITYNVSIDGVTVNDNAAIRGAVLTIIDEALVSATARRRA